MTNLEIASLLRTISACLVIQSENRFKIIAYEKAAESIQHLTESVEDRWKNGTLKDIPGVGTAIASSLVEICEKGYSDHFNAILSTVPKSVFPLLEVPGLGPKRAFILVTRLKLANDKTVFEDLKRAGERHEIASLEGFGETSEKAILDSIELAKKGFIKEERILLPDAEAIADEVITYLKTHAEIGRVDTLGSLRRKNPTIGDIDIAVTTDEPQKTLEAFVSYPHERRIDKGEKGATLVLHSGRQVDLRVCEKDSYGAMLQYFTGSKQHNIALREYAIKKHLSLNEYGIKNAKGNVKKFSDEKKFYEALGLSYVPPELRENRGEVESSLRTTQGKPDGLPVLVESTQILGDLHIHTSYDLSSSHDLGSATFEEHLKKGVSLGYEYIGIADHNPSVSIHTPSEITAIMKKRKEWYEIEYQKFVKKTKSKICYFLLCEVDILVDGSLALPDEAFEYIDAAIVSIHSSFTQESKTATDRVLRAFSEHPKVRIFGHPTGRLLTKREGIQPVWQTIFSLCKEKNIALEINASPERLDLPDDLVFEARKKGVKFVINTDSHDLIRMEMMKYGLAVARRGWCTKHDILNSHKYPEFAAWLSGKEDI
ncbi:hypothetical protein HY947_06120 [Candidatus Gottesmanbacteria bacterium]|nr:hypothetical protein [Candidatus Gottesmanbacteria bacterium]